MSNEKNEVFRQGQQRVLDAYPEIIDALVAEAKEGSCQHAKFLFDLVQAAPEKKRDQEDDDNPGPSLAEILLERLQTLEEEDAAARLSAESAAHA